MTDGQIIELFFLRDERAIAETARAYGAFCGRVAANLLDSREDAEECVLDAYHAAWRRIPPERPASLKAFLGRITRNLSVSRFRAQRAKKRGGGMELLLSELEDCVPSPDTVERELEARQLSALISAWLDTLSPDDRALFVRRYWYGDGVGALARECGATQNGMAQRMLRLRRGLRAALEAEGAEL